MANIVVVSAAALLAPLAQPLTPVVPVKLAPVRVVAAQPVLPALPKSLPGIAIPGPILPGTRARLPGPSADRLRALFDGAAIPADVTLPEADLLAEIGVVASDDD